MTIMLFVFCLFAFLKADIPSACDPQTEINGTWTFHIGSVVDTMFNCSSVNVSQLIVVEDVTVIISIEKDGRHNVYLNNSLVGRWSSMDVEGFDVFVNQDNTGIPLHYQAYFNFTLSEDAYVTNCSRTLGGWVRKDVVLPDEFKCFWGEKLNEIGVNESNKVYARGEKERYVNNRRVLRKYKKPFQVKPQTSSSSTKSISMPEELDWSNYNGQNFVDPVYDQGDCGSCYVFHTLSALEGRLRIFSRGTINVSLSQQDIVSCSFYSQSCEGGFGEEVGYWAKDHGVVDNKCFPYSGTPSSCSLCDSPTFYYAANMSYVGGYFGACTEELMLEALQDGPLPVGICASAWEFLLAQPGTIIDSNNTCSPDHGVLLVGYGNENGIPWWKIKNSWGEGWADGGYGRIRRGKNCLQIESAAEIINPVVVSVPTHGNSVIADGNSVIADGNSLFTEPSAKLE